MMNRALVALAIASVTVFAACSSSTTSDPTADESKAKDGGSLDASLDGSFDGSFDASLPPLPPAFAACASCMETTCAPSIEACDADPDCTALLACSITSGCLAADNAASCVSACGTSLGLTKVQTAQEEKLLTEIATSCASCLAECPKPDASAPDGGQ